MAARVLRMLVVLVLLALAMAALLVVSPTLIGASGGKDAPAGWCQGGLVWIVRGQSTLTDPKCGSGSFVLTSDQWGIKSFPAFVQAETFRAGRDCSYWFEPEPKVAATTTLTTTMAVSVVSQVTMNWQNFCSGISPVVVSGGGVLNIGLDQLDLPCGKGTYILIEPWRPGCGGNTSENPNCNVGRQWKFASWAELVRWMADGKWTEGSVWFVPDSWPAATTATSTLTSTPVPTKTSTPVPTNTPTPVPTKMSTPVPTPTWVPTATPMEVYNVPLRTVMVPKVSVPPTAGGILGWFRGWTGVGGRYLPRWGWFLVALGVLLALAILALLVRWIIRSRRAIGAFFRRLWPRLPWWGWVLILLAIVGLGVGIFLIIKLR